MTRLAVFDCDGTLVDSQANIVRAMDATFAGAGLSPPSAAATRAIVGLSLPQAMRALLPDADTATHLALADAYRDRYRALRAAGAMAHEPLYDGIAELIDTLLSDGWLLGVATGKSDAGLARALAAHGLADRFATIQTADRHPSKPDPAMLRAAIAETGAAAHACAMIGDTGFDMAMARAAGVRAVGVSWGYHPCEALWAAGADAVADHAREVAGMLAGVAA